MNLQGFPIDRKPYSNNLIKRDFNLGLQCYMISKKGAQTLYDYYKKHGIENHVDKTMNRVDMIKFSSKEPIGTTSSKVFESKTVENKRPYILNKILDDFHNINPDVSDAWFLSESDLRIGKIEVNCWFGFFIILGLIAGFFNIPFIVKFLLILFSLDTLITKDFIGLGIDVTTVAITFFIGFLMRY